MVNITIEQANIFYNELKELILSKNNEPNFYYEKKKHRLYEENATDEIREAFYNEKGKIEYQNNNGDIIVIEIKRWHGHRHNGWSGLNITPFLSATIGIKKDDIVEIIWELKVESWAFSHSAEATDTQTISKSLLQPTESKETIINEYEINKLKEARFLAKKLKDFFENDKVSQETKQNFFEELFDNQLEGYHSQYSKKHTIK